MGSPHRGTASPAALVAAPDRWVRRRVVARFQCYRMENHAVRWRLLGGNNRVLGVSAKPADDHAAALAEVETVRTRLADAIFEVEHVPAGQWWWHMVVDGVESAQSAHGFARRIDALLSSRRFTVLVPDADADRTLVVFQPGRRGRESLF